MSEVHLSSCRAFHPGVLMSFDVFFRTIPDINRLSAADLPGKNDKDVHQVKKSG